MTLKNKITIHDVAKESGVSITTVSRVINNNYPVKTETRKKVEAAIKKLQFRPNLVAKGLINNRTNTIGVIVPSIANLFFPAVVEGIEVYFRKKELTIFLTESDGDAKEEEKLIQTLIDRQVDGIIVIDPRIDNIKNGFLEDITKIKPTVLVNGYHKGIYCNFVINDQEIGTIKSIQYLIDNGHKKIGFLRAENSYSYDIKENIYYEVLQKNNIDVNKHNILTISEGNSIQTTDLSAAIVIKRLKEQDKPTAIFACNDNMAVGALNGAHSLGLEIPNDLSIIGYDNTIISQLTIPKLTTVDQNMYKLGQTAAKKLDEIILQKDNDFTKVVLPTTLVKRESVRDI